MSSIFSLLFLLSFLSCGAKDDGSLAVSSWDETFASGFAISSPLASQTVISLQRINHLTSTLDGDETLEEKTEFLDQIVEGADVNTCNVQLPAMNGFSGSANCYGPSINYSNHPDGIGGSGTLPSGDLGIWEASNGGEVCVAAQMNTLMKNVSSYVDAALMIQASMICLLKNTAVEFTAGEMIDVRSEFEASLQVSQPNLTLTTASVIVYDALSTFVIAGTLDTNKPFSISIKIKQKADDSYQGKVSGFFTTTNMDSFSVSFVKNVNSIQAKLTAGSWSSGTSETTIFNSDGDLNQDDSFSGNMNHALLNINSETGAAQISYAWQAGAGDSHTRVFNASVNSSGSSGCGYFGFGDDFHSDLTQNTNTINGFICNWAGPGNDHSMIGTQNKAQRQCFTKSAGIFIEDQNKRAITYAPTVSCDDSDSLTYDWPSHSADNATNDLVDLTSDPDFSNFRAPTLPSLDSDL